MLGNSMQKSNEALSEVMKKSLGGPNFPCAMQGLNLAKCEMELLNQQSEGYFSVYNPSSIAKDFLRI